MLRGRFLIPLLLLAIAWIQELLDQVLFSGQWNLPMGQNQPLWGVLTAPFSHSGFPHLISNSIVFLPLSWLVLTRGTRDYVAVWIAVICLEIPVALPGLRSARLSGVVYGLLGYLLLIGCEKKILSILLSLVAFWLYGSAMFALIPGMSPAGVSWIGHASGFAAGIIAAWAVHRESSTDGIRDQ